MLFYNDEMPMDQWCSKATKLQDQDQDHLFFQDQDQFFKTKTAFFKDHQIINPRPLAKPEILIGRGPNWKIFVTLLWWRFFGAVMMMTSLKLRHNYILKFDFVVISFKNHH